jgi:hypothetical protein
MGGPLGQGGWGEGEFGDCGYLLLASQEPLIGLERT